MPEGDIVHPQYVTTMTPLSRPESVDTNSPAWISDAQYRMTRRSQLMRDLYEGFPAIERNIAAYMPRHPNEEDADYNMRKAMMSFRNFYGQAVISILGKMFAVPMSLKDDVPQAIKSDLEDADLQGNDWTTVAKEYVRYAVNEGMSWMLTDYADVGEIADNLTLADERELGLRPYWVVVPASRVLGIKYRKVGATYRLTQFRYIDYVDVDDGEFGSTLQETIRIYEPHRIRTMVKGADGNWKLEGDKPNTVGTVTAVPLILDRNGRFEAKPPLENLAHMNKEHLQIRSDQRRALSVASYPMLVTRGVTANPGQTTKIGPLTSIMLEDHQADVKWVESQGKHLEAGDRELNKLEGSMRTFGLSFENPQMYATATGRNIDASDAVAPIQLWALATKDALEITLGHHARWRKLPSGGSISVDTTFLKNMLSVETLKLLVEALKEGALSPQGFLQRMKDYGILGDDFDVNGDIKLALKAAETAAELLAKSKPDPVVPPNGNDTTTPPNNGGTNA